MGVGSSCAGGKRKGDSGRQEILEGRIDARNS